MVTNVTSERPQWRRNVKARSLSARTQSMPACAACGFVEVVGAEVC
jgi:hypothetical protein